ncbi:uncharacterized protein LOC132264448 [Phlebotomus argentipes]|uniref:uncharacterized protein LOC132261604 n=1 Tax=Phlebotomus argentipes TaxID=94469 RepID=UPI002892E6AF|nr:uncharacterized protein LOC132261604 [Phlebotomus argentipes]XP_059620647.1 uncharacterized protein LOC132264448 [Phlebotomus argentipes]
MVRHREHQENVRLVRLVKQNPCLYDFGMSEYSDREFIEKVWKKIADEMGDNPQNIRDKWRNLRTVFLRKLKAEQNGQTLKCRYYLMDEMKFIMPFVKMTVPYQVVKSAADEEDNLDSKNTDEEEESAKKRVLRGRRVKPDPSEEQRDCEEYEVVLEEPYVQSSTTTPGDSTDKKRLIRSIMQEIDTENETYSINLSEVKSQKRKFTPETENPRKLFLLSLMPEMEQMTDKQMSGFRRKVLALLDDILYPDE